MTRWELILATGAHDALPLGDRSAYDKKTSTSEGMCGLDGPFKPLQEYPSGSANLQENWCMIRKCKLVLILCHGQRHRYFFADDPRMTRRTLAQLYIVL